MLEIPYKQLKGFPGSSTVKTPPARQEPQETWVQSLRREDSPGERNGNPLQYSWLENSMDRGAWWAAVHGVTQSWTQLSLHTHIYWVIVAACGLSLVATGGGHSLAVV